MSRFYHDKQTGQLRDAHEPHIEEEPAIVADAVSPGMKFDEGKLDWGLVPWEALEDSVKVLMDGAAKYERWNWTKVANGKLRYLNAAMRHLFAHARGQYRDPESGHPHIAHVLVNMIFLCYLHKGE